MIRRDRQRSQAIAADRSRTLREGTEPSIPTTGTIRRGPRLRTILLVALAVVAILGVAGGWLLWQRVATFNAAISHSDSISRLFFPLMGSQRVNIVIFGYGGETHHDGRFLADSINILSFDPASHTTTIIPIPRDLWIEGQPRLPDNGKVNEAFAIGYAAGGIPRAAAFTNDLLSAVTGLQFQGWLALDFEGFRGMVDAVHGVTIDNPRAFRYTWYRNSFERGVFQSGRFAKGILELDGDAALSYVRARFTNKAAESSDFARSVRQQRVLSALQAKLGAGIGAVGPGLALMDSLQTRLQTDLSTIDLYLIIDRLTADRRIELREDEVLEATTNTIGQYILVVVGGTSGTDYGPLQAYLAAELARPMPTPEPSPSASP